METCISQEQTKPNQVNFLLIFNSELKFGSGLRSDLVLEPKYTFSHAAEARSVSNTASVNWKKGAGQKKQACTTLQQFQDWQHEEKHFVNWKEAQSSVHLSMAVKVFNSLAPLVGASDTEPPLLDPSFLS